MESRALGSPPGNFIVYPSPSFKCAIKVLPLSSGVDKENIIPPRNDYAVCRCRVGRISGMRKCNERKYSQDISAFYSAALGKR